MSLSVLRSLFFESSSGVLVDDPIGTGVYKVGALSV